MTKEERAVLIYVGHWWRSHRPLGWTNAQHLANPQINTHGRTEKALARSYARLATLRRRRLLQGPGDGNG